MLWWKDVVGKKQEFAAKQKSETFGCPTVESGPEEVDGASVSSQPVSQPVSWRERPARSAAQSVSQDERPGELACSVSPDILIPHLLCTQSSMFCVLKIT